MTAATTTATAETTTMAMLSVTMTTMVLGEGQRLCEAGMAVQREQSAMETTELERLGQIPTANYICNRRAYGGLRSKIIWVYGKTSMKTMLGYFRVDDNIKEGMHLYTVQQQISKSQQDTRDVRSIEAMPSGLEGPSLSLLFKLFYLQLPHFRDCEFLQSINESLSVDALTVQRSQSGRPATASLQDEDAYITVDRSELVGRHIVEWLAKADSIPVLDIVQRHHEVSFYLGDITDEWDVLDILERSGITYIVQNALLWRGAKDPSVYFRGYVEGTRAIIEAAITASVHKLVYTSSTGVVFDSTDIMNLFNVYNLLPYRSTTSSKPRLDPEGTTAKLNESLHHALPPICATTEYHHTTQTLSSYVAPTPNAESILSVFNTPFDPCGLTDPIVRSRSDGQAFFITNGEAFGILDFTRVYNEKVQCLRRGRSDIQVAVVWKCKATHKDKHRTIKSRLHKTIQQLYYEWGEWVQYTRERMLTLQCSVEGKEMFDDEGWEAAWWILATTTGLDVDRQPCKIGSVIRWSTMGADPELDSSNFRFEFGRSKVLNQVEVQSLISEGKEDAKVPFSVLIQGYSTAKYRALSVKVKRINRDGQFEAAHQYLASRLHLPDCEVEGQQLRLSELSAHTCRSRRPINKGDARMDRLKGRDNGERRWATRGHSATLSAGLRPPGKVPDEVRGVKHMHAQRVEGMKMKRTM
ncbi:hypothetical protein BKA82DRAFT_4015822 [Pisolithus tinctorius]|nr:hypothetical protein BKA82DRAFT_4015822 [Pisolithus tinctorius]